MILALSTQKQHCRAAVLVEAMIGVAISALVIAAAYLGMASGFQVMQLTRDNMRATQIMLEHIESLRGNKWTRIESSPPADFTEYYTPADTNAGSGTLFSGTVTVTNATLSPMPSPAPAYFADLKSITITVRWTNRLASHGINHPQMRTMTTFVTRYGL
jgi:hypothetical protein